MSLAHKGNHPIYQEFAEALDLVEAKAHDYAEDDNVFSNFEFAAQVAGVETVQVFAVLLGVKVARLGQLIGHGKVPNFESIDDTLLDTMNYAGLLKAYMRANTTTMTISEAMDAAEEEGLGFEVGQVIELDTNDPTAQFKYRVTGIGPTHVRAVPTEDWEEELGEGTRSFVSEQIRLV